MICDEPVRGHPPPPWFYLLEGIERLRAFGRGMLLLPPMARLLGIRATHIVAGRATFAMPASEALVFPNGQLVITPLMSAALEGATQTALGAGMSSIPLRFESFPFRPAWLRHGNLIARARVVNTSNLYIFAEVEVEDPDGRQLGQGTLHSGLRRIDPPPPPLPDSMQPVLEPVYETPDPYLRSFTLGNYADLLERQNGETIMRQVVDGVLGAPYFELFGICPEVNEDGRTVLTMPASEWFCGFERQISCHAIAGFADICGGTLSISLHKPGKSMTIVDSTVRFLHPVDSDGRRLRAEGKATEVAEDMFLLNTTIHDADGRLVALHTGLAARLDSAHRVGPRTRQSERILATLLFTDIANSTEHAHRLGDAEWQGLLERHKLAVRREVSRFNGREIDTAGDGFFIRFDSPAQAIEAARAVRKGTAPLGTDIRAGIHTGECEMKGGTLVGMAVHIAARIQAAAKPGEILVSSTVKELATSSTVRFEDKGVENLKGVPDPWHVYAVTE